MKAIAAAVFTVFAVQLDTSPLQSSRSLFEVKVIFVRDCIGCF